MKFSKVPTADSVRSRAYSRFWHLGLEAEILQAIPVASAIPEAAAATQEAAVAAATTLEALAAREMIP